ncbi:MAG: undecaprenyl-diphosphate phosphatase [Acidobacteria bacterium]|nr:undecaprenyl-diphosphate phosphatase [Acidobacteriota bacterium]
MSLLTAALLGVIQGLTEFLPVSSTAHLLVAQRLLHVENPTFTVAIQFGSILAVMWLYRRKLWSVATQLPSSDGSAARQFAVMIVLAFLPAAVAGYYLSKFIKSVLYESAVAIPIAFIVGGIVMLLVERYRPAPTVARADETPIPKAFAIGCWQVLALVPGVSRSGATIVGGLMAGLERSAAAEFSFFLAMPTMAGAFAKDMWDVRHELTSQMGAEIAVGLVMAFIASALVMGPFLRFVGRSGFAPFAWYRIVAGIVLLGMVWAAR